MEFSAEKSFEKSFFQEIPRNFPRKKCTKNRPLVTLLAALKMIASAHFSHNRFSPFTHLRGDLIRKGPGTDVMIF
jgi:hypothetical protein